VGNAANNVIRGGVGADILNGADGDDTLIAGAGADVLVGGAGSDTADYSGSTGAVSVRLSGQFAFDDGFGARDVYSSIENANGSIYDDLLFGSAGDNVLSGGLGADILLGLDGNDTLIGGSGAANTLQGGQGDDIYVVTANDTITEFANQGTDTVRTTQTGYTLGANLEILEYSGSGVFHGTGNALDNVITGGDGNDTLVGGGGNDTLNGGLGTDTVVLRGIAGEYQVTYMGGDTYQVVDTVNGRDGTTLVSGVEQLQFSNLTAFLSPVTMPLLSDKEAGPQTLPTLADDDFLPIGKDAGEPLVLPGSDDLYVFDKHAGDALVLPGLDDAGGWDFMVTTDAGQWLGHGGHGHQLTVPQSDDLLAG
ncbi:MAG: calcium-binding protein, partial [Brevundimonas sp.]